MNYSLIIKATNNCNLNCSYCYHRRDYNRDFGCNMSHDTIALMIKNVLRYNEDYAEFIWHGGEPLMIGLETFKFIVEKEHEYNEKNLKILNSVQTNGTLLNDKYIHFFNENNFHIGISIDGPFALHSAQRGTTILEYENILMSLKKLNEVNARYGVLCVVGKNHRGHEEEIFKLFTEYGIKHMGFLPCLVHENGIIDHELTISPGEYGQFLINFFEAWIHGNTHGICVRNFDDCIRFFKKRPVKTCINANCCIHYLTVLPDGNMYLCDNFSSDQKHWVGDVAKGFENISSTEAMKWLQKSMIQIPEKCVKCKFYCGCGSGCKYLRWVNDQHMSKTQYYCQSTHMIFNHIGNYFNIGEN